MTQTNLTNIAVSVADLFCGKVGEVGMNTEPELLNERLERLAMVLDEIMPKCAVLVRDALALLNEQQGRIETLESLRRIEQGGR